MSKAFKEKLQRELEQLMAARRKMYRRRHYSTVADILEESGLPYKLFQTDRNELGEPVRGYRYYFASKWDSGCALYIQETFAGRAYASMGKSIDALEYVLKERIRTAGIRKEGK